tara:strand:+ start:113 stop:259 length:147 start_codon:yes stop_codon:yes gene_type:complete
MVKKLMSDAKKKRMLDWIKKHPQKNKGRNKKQLTTNAWGNVKKGYLKW